MLIGEPGSGKTAIAGRLSQFSDGTELHPKLIPGFLKAAHFCSVADNTWIDPTGFCTSLTLQLSQIQEYAIALVNIDSGSEQQYIEANQTVNEAKNSIVQNVVIQKLHISKSMSAQEAFNKFVRNPLKLIYSNGFNEQITILIDGLDEASMYTGEQTIANLLSGIRELPSQVRFILTTRPQIEEVLQNFTERREYSITVGEGLIQSRKDIEQYVRNVLKKESALSDKLACNFPQEMLVKTVGDKSEGNFLYVSYLLEGLSKQEEDITQILLNSLPEGLDGIYKNFLTRLVEKGDKRGNRNTWREYSPILGILAIAQEALTEEQLANFVKKRRSEVRKVLNEELLQFLDTDELLLPTQRTYTLYHRSLADFLLDEDRAGNYWCEAQMQHENIINYYEPEHTSWDQACDRVIKKIEEEIDIKRSSYGLRYLAHHLVQAEHVGKFT